MVQLVELPELVVVRARLESHALPADHALHVADAAAQAAHGVGFAALFKAQQVVVAHDAAVHPQIGRPRRVRLIGGEAAVGGPGQRVDGPERERQGGCQQGSGEGGLCFFHGTGF
jgi:hypothetical protein